MLFRSNVDPNSTRLQILEPWPAWDGEDFKDMPVLVKATGKCTTDHISPAGAWLRFRGHLDNLSDNMFLGAVNAFTDDPGTGRNQLSGEQIQPIPEIAREYRSEEHTSELQSQAYLVRRLLLEKKNPQPTPPPPHQPPTPTELRITNT